MNPFLKQSKWLILTLAVCSACVPPTRFRSLQALSDNCRMERDRMMAENESLGVENRELKARAERTEQTLKKAARDTLQWKEQVNLLQTRLKQADRDFSDLREAHDALLIGTEGEIRRLMDELQEREKEVQLREKNLVQLQSGLRKGEEELSKTRAELELKATRLTELERLISEQENQMTELRRKVSEALLGFENQGLTVTRKNGKVYVSLEEKLLFKSGSIQVDPKGVTALQKLAGVLEQQPEIHIMIEGHTDDVPVMAGSAYKDNWDLSVLRATSIVRILLSGSALKPERITVAGRGPYQPVEAAKTNEARQKNRRTEIILSPNLEDLLKLAGQ